MRKGVELSSFGVKVCFDLNKYKVSTHFENYNIMSTCVAKNFIKSIFQMKLRCS